MRIRIRDQQSKNLLAERDRRYGYRYKVWEGERLLAETGGTSRRGLDYLVSRSITRFVQHRPIYHDA